MPTTTFGQDRLKAIGRGWRGLSRRRRTVLGLVAPLALVTLVVSASFYGWRASWRPRLVLTMPHAHYPVAFSPDGTRLATSGPDGVTFWDVSDGSKRAAWELSHSPPRDVYGAVFSPDGRTFVALSYLQRPPCSLTVDLIDVSTGRTRATIPGGDAPLPFRYTFSGDSRKLRLVRKHTSNIEVIDYDITILKMLSSHLLNRGLTGNQFRYDLSKDGLLLAVANCTGYPKPGSTPVVVLWNLDQDREIGRLRAQAAGPLVRSLSFSADGTVLALGCDDGSMEVWDPATRRLRATFRGHQAGFVPYAVWVSPDGSTLASFGTLMRPALGLTSLEWHLHRQVSSWLGGRRPQRPDELLVLDIRNGRYLGRVLDEAFAVFSPDGRTLANSTEEGTRVEIRDIRGTVTRKPGSAVP